MDVPQLIQSPSNVCHFQYFAVTDNAAVNNSMPVYFHVIGSFFFQVDFLGVGLLDQKLGTQISNFVRYCQIPLQKGYIICTPTSNITKVTCIYFIAARTYE